MKFRNGPTPDKAKFRIFGVINVCRSIVEKEEESRPVEVCRKTVKSRRRRETRYAEVRVRTRKQIARRKVFHPSFRALSLPDLCQVWSGYYLLWIYHEQALVFKMLAGVRLVICGLYGQKGGQRSLTWGCWRKTVNFREVIEAKSWELNAAKRKIEGGGGKSVYEREVAVVRYVSVMVRLFLFVRSLKIQNRTWIYMAWETVWNIQFYNIWCVEQSYFFNYISILQLLTELIVD